MHQSGTQPRSRTALIIRLLLYAVITAACWSALGAVYAWQTARHAARALPAAARILGALHTAGYATDDPDGCARLLEAVGRGRTVAPRVRPVYASMGVNAVRRISFARVPAYEFGAPEALRDSVFTAPAGSTADRLYLFSVGDGGPCPAPVLLGRDGTVDTLTDSQATARRQAWYGARSGRYAVMHTFNLPAAFRRTPVERISVRPGDAFRGITLHRAGGAKDAWVPLRFTRTFTYAGVPYVVGGTAEATAARRAHVGASGRYAGFRVLLAADSAVAGGGARLFRPHEARPTGISWEIGNLAVVPALPGVRMLYLPVPDGDSTLFFDIRPAQGRVSVIAAAADGLPADSLPHVAGFTVTPERTLAPDDALRGRLAGARWYVGDGGHAIPLPGYGARLRYAYAPPVPVLLLRILLVGGAAGLAVRMRYREAKRNGA